MSESVSTESPAYDWQETIRRNGGPLLFAVKNIEEIVSCIGMGIIIIVVSINVVLRYLFSRSMPWTEEVSVICFSCVIFLGSAAVHKRGMHVGIDFVVNLLPEKLRNAVAFATRVFLTLFMGWVAWLGWVYAIESWEKPTSILFIPYFFVNIPICLGFASMTIYSAIGLARAVGRHRRLQREKEGGA